MSPFSLSLLMDKHRQFVTQRNYKPKFLVLGKAERAVLEAVILESYKEKPEWRNEIVGCSLVKVDTESFFEFGE